jgi:two-component system, LytTR family, sensor histidine kinase AgrC
MLYCFTLFERTVKYMFHIIFTILYPLLMSAISSTIIINISMIKLSKQGIYMYTFTNYLLVSVFHHMNQDKILFPVMTIITIIYTYVIIRKLYSSIITAIVSSLIFILSDAVAGVLMIYILNLNYSNYELNEKAYFITGVAILIIAFIISKLVKLMIGKFQTYNNILKEYAKENLLLILYIVLGICTIYANFIIYKQLALNINKSILFLYMLIIVVFFAVAIVLISISNRNIKNKLENQFKAQEYEQLKEYTNMLEIVSNDMRKFKHDYLNILKTIGSYIEAEDIKGLRDFYKNELMPESNIVIGENKSLSLLQNIKISPLKGLISSKIIYAQSKSIHTNIEIVDNIESLSIGTIDICRIMGVILDNAIEAAMSCEVRKINLAIVRNEDNTIITVTNSCPSNTPPVHKIYEKDFSTKGEGRGMGLKIVKEIIYEKYSNILINTKIKDGIFKQEINIFEKKNDN